MRARTFSRDCSRGLGSRVGKSSSELPLGLERIFTATVVSFHFARYTLPKDPSPICFCICICSKFTCAEDTGFSEASAENLGLKSSEQHGYFQVQG